MKTNFGQEKVLVGYILFIRLGGHFEASGGFFNQLRDISQNNLPLNEVLLDIMVLGKRTHGLHPCLVYKFHFICRGMP